MLALAVAFLPFAFVTTITPGPNNLMLAASGANFGFRRTIPHMLGIAIGFPVMVAAVGLGLGSVLTEYPVAHAALKWIGAAYLLWLAWKIASAGPAEPGRAARGEPLTFMQAAAFQWLNPKAWVMAAGATTTYTTVGGDVLTEVLVIAGVFASVTLPCIAVWIGFGIGISRILRHSPRALRAFNVAMGLLLAASIIPFLS